MSEVTKLLHTRYRVDDLERTVKFYREVLGLEEIKRHKSPRGSELVFLKAPESREEIEICFLPGSEPVRVQPDLTHLAFEVDSLEAFPRGICQTPRRAWPEIFRRPDHHFQRNCLCLC
jgi:lactoylglutathione lyase